VKRIVWTEAAKADVRALDKPTAMRVLSALHRFAESGAGDVKALEDREELRLRIGDYRLFLLIPPSRSSRFFALSIAAKPTVDVLAS
jgi:mRNA interferase RelE/StbE